MTKSSLSPARQRLVRMIQQVNFGKISNLTVRAGEPVFEPGPIVTRDIMFRPGADNGPHPDTTLRDFVLRGAFVTLFHELDALQHGTIEVIQVAGGVPVRMAIPALVA